MERDRTSNVTICSATVADGRLRVILSDGRDLATPIEWYPVLAKASAPELAEMESSPYGLHWASLDEDVSLDGMLAGKMSTPQPSSQTFSPIVELADVRRQKRLLLLADSMIDYPEQQEILSRLANE